jgi:ribosome-associated toxin RatA of RatAB toxin-antitoxin module
MKTVEKSVLIWFSAREMFDLIVDVPSYPQFLPWCDKADILTTTDDGMTARIGMAFGGLHKSFTTANTHIDGLSKYCPCYPAETKRRTQHNKKKSQLLG